uniref:Uncharacterized protein n=1 Tax=Amphimedon queenslandica TaxID=400682 RepID=A0A1X7VSS5_AMPQE
MPGDTTIHHTGARSVPKKVLVIQSIIMQLCLQPKLMEQSLNLLSSKAKKRYQF